MLRMALVVRKLKKIDEAINTYYPLRLAAKIIKWMSGFENEWMSL
jgi:hypothetical protein